MQQRAVKRPDWGLQNRLLGVEPEEVGHDELLVACEARAIGDFGGVEGVRDDLHHQAPDSAPVLCAPTVGNQSLELPNERRFSLNAHEREP